MVLLVNQLTIPVFLDVANAIAGSGKTVTLFTGKVEESYAMPHNDIRIVHSKAYNRKSLVTRLLSWMIFSTHLFFYLLFKRGIAHILVVTNPPFAPIIVSWIARLRNISYSIVVYDLYPEALLQTGLSSEQNWVYKLWQKINPKVFNKARTVITLSESMKAALMPYLQKPDDVRIIYNWVETGYMKPLLKSENPFIQRHSLQDKITVMYSGNMGMTHDLESLIHAAELLKDQSNVQFILIGDGAKRLKLESMAGSLQLTNVLFLPYQSTADFPFAMAAADIGVVTLGRGGEGISVPSKTYINLAAGVCLLTISPTGSELNRLVEVFNCGFTCEPDNPQNIAKFITDVLTQPERLNQFKERSREASYNFGSTNANRYIEIVQ